MDRNALKNCGHSLLSFFALSSNDFFRSTFHKLVLDPGSNSSKSPLKIFDATKIQIFMKKYKKAVVGVRKTSKNLQVPETRCRSASASRLHLGALTVNQLDPPASSGIKNAIKIISLVIVLLSDRIVAELCYLYVLCYYL